MNRTMTRDEIETYLQEVGRELDRRSLVGEILITGGAYMSLVLNARESTKDVDAFISGEVAAIREAVATVGQRHGLPSDWLNDAVKSFLYAQPDTELWAQYPGLRVYVPTPDYIFAMKADAARPEDREDLVRLKNELGLRVLDEAIRIVERYVPPSRVRAQTHLMLESIFE